MNKNSNINVGIFFLYIINVKASIIRPLPLINTQTKHKLNCTI